MPTMNEVTEVSADNTVIEEVGCLAEQNFHLKFIRDGFLFALRETVKINVSGDKGHIVARCEYTNAVNRYLVQYVTKMGAPIEEWWPEDALTSEE